MSQNKKPLNLRSSDSTTGCHLTTYCLARFLTSQIFPALANVRVDRNVQKSSDSSTLIFTSFLFCYSGSFSSIVTLKKSPQLKQRYISVIKLLAPLTRPDFLVSTLPHFSHFTLSSIFSFFISFPPSGFCLDYIFNPYSIVNITIPPPFKIIVCHYSIYKNLSIRADRTLIIF